MLCKGRFFGNLMKDEDLMKSKSELIAELAETKEQVLRLENQVTKLTQQGAPAGASNRHFRLKKPTDNVATMYAMLFEESPLPTWVGNYSAIKKFLDKKKNPGHCLSERRQVGEKCAAMLSILTVNQAALYLFEADSGQTLQQGLSTIYAADALHKFVDALAELADGKSCCHFEATVQSLCGKLLEIEQIWTIAPGCEDNWDKILVTTIDNTESKAARRALNASREKLRAVLDTTPNFILTIDHENRIEFINRTLSHLSKADVIGSDVVGWVAEGYRQDFERVLKRAWQTGKPQAIETRSIGNDNADAWYLVRIGSAMEGDRIALLTLAWSDITARKHAEQRINKLNEELEDRVMRRTAELKAVNEELESFAYSVSHDLRAPLRAINGFSNALIEDYGPELNLEAQEYLNRICSASTRMGKLIDDLLSLSRITRAQMRRQTLDLSEIAQNVLTELRQAEPDRQVETVVHPGLSACGDRTLLQVAIGNLIGNAWKFTSREKHAVIELGCMQHDKKVFFIKDNGAGFDMAYAKNLFGPFQRLHSVDEFEGTGIGLATVQRIFHRHGGKIWAEAEVKRGATFYFTIP